MATSLRSKRKHRRMVRSRINKRRRKAKNMKQVKQVETIIKKQNLFERFIKWLKNLF